jgi:hypothetical protein
MSPRTARSLLQNHDRKGVDFMSPRTARSLLQNHDRKGVDLVSPSAERAATIGSGYKEYLQFSKGSIPKSRHKGACCRARLQNHDRKGVDS